MLQYFAYAVAGLATLCFLFDWLCGVFDDSREPPRAKPRIPIIGHALGFLKLGADYYVQLANEQKCEIYTLGVFNLKIYVINSRQLIPQVQRQAQNLSLKPFVQFATKAFVDVSKHTFDLHGDPEFVRDLGRVNKEYLSPSPHLDYQNLRANNSLNNLIGESVASGTFRIGLHAWTRHLITIASTDGVFGTSNPLLKEENSDDFWAWQEGAMTIWAGWGFLVPGSIKARERLVNAFVKYHRGDHSDAAQIIKQRVKLMQDYGAPDEDVARMHLFFGQGVLPNSVPAAFWTIYEVFSRPDLVRRLREAIIEHGIHRDNRSDTIELDVSALKTRVPLLLAVLEETQRVRGANATFRKVQTDTVLGDYHLKRGNWIQIPHQPVHHDSRIWGTDPLQYNPDRFLGKTLPSNSLSAWGTAPHLCPARQFASTEIMVLIALLVLRVEIVPIGGSGWRKLKVRPFEAATIPPPAQELEVEIQPREGWNEGLWVLKMGESKTRVPLASG